MAFEVTMPQLGLTMKEGLITEWKKHVGETVAKGEVLFSVENDKATIDVDAQTDGLLAEIVVGERITVPVGAMVAVIATAGETVQKRTPNKTMPNEPAPGVTAEPRPSAGIPGVRMETEDGFILASPLARRMADTMRMNLAEVRGTGPEGAVISRDLPVSDTSSRYEEMRGTSLKRGSATPEQTPSMRAQSSAGMSGGSQQDYRTYEDIDLTRIQKIAAERMTESWTTIPQFTLYDEADASMILRIAESFKRSGEPVSLTVIIAKLLAHAAEKHPLVNASWIGDGQVRTYKHVHVNIAMDTPDGLVVPVLRDCAQRGFRTLGEDMRVLAEKAKTKALAPLDYEGGTITLSNLGMFGIKRFRAIVNPPQTAILAVGALCDRVVAGENGFETKKVLEYSITADHRAVDGACAARFMASFKSLIENPLMTMN